MAQRPQNRNYNGFPPNLPFSNPNQHFPNSQIPPHHPYNNSQFTETLGKSNTYRSFNNVAHDTIIKPLECINHTFCIPCLRSIVRDCLQFPSIPGLTNITKAINVLTTLVSSIEWSDLYYVIGMGGENSDEFQNENENEQNQFFQNGVIEFYKKKKNYDIFLNFYNFLITTLFKLAPIYRQEIQKSLYLTPIFYENRDVRNGQQFMNNNHGDLNNVENIIPNNFQNNFQNSNLNHRNPIHMNTPRHISQPSPQKSTNNTYNTRGEPNKANLSNFGNLNNVHKISAETFEYLKMFEKFQNLTIISLNIFILFSMPGQAQNDIISIFLSKLLGNIILTKLIHDYQSIEAQTGDKNNEKNNKNDKNDKNHFQQEYPIFAKVQLCWYRHHPR
jgi:hypothetical protein